MIHGKERLVEREGQRLRGTHSDHERTGKAWAVCNGDRVEITELDARALDRFANRGRHGLEVCSRRNFGYDSAVPSVLIHRRCNHVGEKFSTAHDTDARLVAARFDSEHERCRAIHVVASDIAQHDHPAGSTAFMSRRMMTASTLSGW